MASIFMDKLSFFFNLDAYNKQIMRLMPANDMPAVVFNDGFRINEFILNQSEAIEILISEVDYGLTGKYK